MSFRSLGMSVGLSTSTTKRVEGLKMFFLFPKIRETSIRPVSLE